MSDDSKVLNELFIQHCFIFSGLQGKAMDHSQSASRVYVSLKFGKESGPKALREENRVRLGETGRNR